MKFFIIAIFGVFISAVLGLFANIIATWFEPVLAKRKKLVLVIFIVLTITSIFFIDEYRNKIPFINIEFDITKSDSGTVFITNDSFLSIENNQMDMPNDSQFIKKENDSLICDIQGNSYNTFFFNGKIWLGKNLSLNTIQSSCYGNDTSNCLCFGRLYTLQRAHQACQLLGKGWRIPTESEYEELIVYYGGFEEFCLLCRDKKIIGKNPQEAYTNLIGNGKSNFNALLGGLQILDDFLQIHESASYWADDGDKNMETTLSYWFSGQDGKIYKVSSQEAQQDHAYCRCIKSVD